MSDTLPQYSIIPTFHYSSEIRVMINSIRIASRPSKLALAQTHMMRVALQKHCPGLEVTVVEISTKGDRDRSDFLYKSQVQGLFTSEVENALLDGRADVAVHSLKDMPTAGSPDLTVAAMPPRESPADVLVAGNNVKGLDDLPEGAKVGTSSLRRIALLKRARPDLNCVPLRGNVETRIGKVSSKEVDAAVMAHAGINRLGLSEHISAVLPLDGFLPAPAQGVLAVQTRAGEEDIVELVSKLDDLHARLAATTERQVLAAMHGGCSIPLGAYAQVQKYQLRLDAIISDVEGKTHIHRSRVSPLDQATENAHQLAQELLDAGGREILEAIRKSK